MSLNLEQLMFEQDNSDSKSCLHHAMSAHKNLASELKHTESENVDHSPLY